MIKRIISIIILVLFTLGMLFISITDNNESLTINTEKKSVIGNTLAKPVIKSISDKITHNTIEETLEDKTGTLDNLKFTVDVTSFNIGDDKNTYIIIGNTATENSYSGEICIKSDSIENIEIGQTYVFTVEPLISMTKPLVVTMVRYADASEIDIIRLHEYREAISNYEACLKKYYTLSLDEIISTSNKDYVTWTNKQIEDFKYFLAEMGYTDDYPIKSVVDIISIPGIIK